jgi:hypothetical protein
VRSGVYDSPMTKKEVVGVFVRFRAPPIKRWLLWRRVFQKIHQLNFNLGIAGTNGKKQRCFVIVPII